MLVQVHTTVQLLGGTTDYCITFTLAAVTKLCHKNESSLMGKNSAKGNILSVHKLQAISKIDYMINFHYNNLKREKQVH